MLDVHQQLSADLVRAVVPLAWCRSLGAILFLAAKMVASLCCIIAHLRSIVILLKRF